jgi:hypothetical protein
MMGPDKLVSQQEDGSMNQDGAKLPEATVRLQQQLEQWRTTQRVGTKLPESFWQSAAELARQHGLNPTAKALRLDYTALKRRVSGALSDPGKPTFVELAGPGTTKLEECVIEFEGSNGSKMRIQWKSAVPPDWGSLLRAWREAAG